MSRWTAAMRTVQPPSISVLCMRSIEAIRQGNNEAIRADVLARFAAELAGRAISIEVVRSAMCGHERAGRVRRLEPEGGSRHGHPVVWMPAGVATLLAGYRLAPIPKPQAVADEPVPLDADLVRWLHPCAQPEAVIASRQVRPVHGYAGLARGG